LVINAFGPNMEGDQMDRTECCEHDWRVNPRKPVPGPNVMIMCAKCGEERVAPFHFERKKKNKDDPRTWKKYTGNIE
jgi:hypothetical protein